MKKRNEEALLKLEQLIYDKHSPKEIAAELNISIPTYYKWLKYIEEARNEAIAKQEEKKEASKRVSSETKEIKEESLYEEPIFPDGEEAIMNFVSRKNSEDIYLISYTGKRNKLSVGRKQQQDAWDNYTNVILKNAENFAQANKERNLEPKWKEYIEKYQLYTSEEHQNKIQLINNNELSLDRVESKVIYQFLYFNQFLSLSLKKAQQLEIFLENPKKSFVEEKEETATCYKLAHDDAPVKDGTAVIDTEKLKGSVIKKTFDSAKQYHVYWYDFPVEPDLYSYPHPCVVVSNDQNNQILKHAMIVPLTSCEQKDEEWIKKREENEFFAKCSVGKDGYMIANQIRSVPQRDLGTCIGKLSKEEISALRKAMKKSLSMDEECVEEQVVNQSTLEQSIEEINSDIQKLLNMRKRLTLENAKLMIKNADLISKNAEYAHVNGCYELDTILKKINKQ